MLLFLDFDGVLHPFDAVDLMPRVSDGVVEFVSASPVKPLFCCLPLLVAALRDFPAVQVVLTTSWRYLYPPEELRAFLGPLGNRYTGDTPRLSGMPRYAEVLAYMHERGLDAVATPWIALEDDRACFPPECGNVLWVDPATGLDEAVVAALIGRLQAAAFGSSGGMAT